MKVSGQVYLVTRMTYVDICSCITYSLNSTCFHEHFTGLNRMRSPFRVGIKKFVKRSNKVFCVKADKMVASTTSQAGMVLFCAHFILHVLVTALDDNETPSRAARGCCCPELDLTICVSQ